MEEIKFWIDNRLDKEVTHTIDEIKTMFIEWMKSKEKSWLEYYVFKLPECWVLEFATTESINQIAEVLNEFKWEYLNSIGIK